MSVKELLKNESENRTTAEQVEATSDNPKVQSAVEQATADQQLLAKLFNRQIENISAGGIKRIIKSLVTFQEVRLKKEEFELHSLTEHLLKAKLTILLTAAANHKVKESEESPSEKTERGTNE